MMDWVRYFALIIEWMCIMKKILLIITSIVIIIIPIVGYVYYIKTVDTRFAVNFSEAFKDYNIDDVDKYLSKDTLIICNGQSSIYENLRENVISACNEKKYLFSDGSSYGYGNNKFIDGVQYVDIKLYGELNGKDIGECNLSMKLKQEGVFRFKIDTIECDEPIFEYLFFSNTN